MVHSGTPVGTCLVRWSQKGASGPTAWMKAESVEANRDNGSVPESKLWHMSDWNPTIPVKDPTGTVVHLEKDQLVVVVDPRIGLRLVR